MNEKVEKSALEPFPEYAQQGTIERIFMGHAFGFSFFADKFELYKNAAKKAGKCLPFIKVDHAPTTDGIPTGGFIVYSPDELKELFYYLPLNSTVSIGFYKTPFYDPNENGDNADE